MELKFTDEQYEAVVHRVHEQVQGAVVPMYQAGRIYAAAALPLLAPVLLGPATDEDEKAYIAGFDSKPAGSYSDRNMRALSTVLAARLAKYLPKPVDPAVEAVNKLFGAKPLTDQIATVFGIRVDDIVAAVRAADRQAK